MPNFEWPLTLRTWLRSAWTFGHTRFRQFPRVWYYSFFFSLLFRSAINAVNVIPLITLLISWPVFAVTVTKSSYSNLPTLGPSAAHLSRKQMLGKTNLLKNFWVFWCWHKFLKIVSEFAKKKTQLEKNLIKEHWKTGKDFWNRKDCHKNLKQWDNIFWIRNDF